MASSKPQSRAGRSKSGGGSGNRAGKTTRGRSGTTSRSRGRTTSARSKSSSNKRAKPRGRAARRQATQPKSAVTKLVDSARSGKGPLLAATAATVVGGVVVRARRRGSRGLDVHGIVKQIGKASKNVGKTSKQVSKDVHQLGEDVERVGKALS